MQTDSRVVFSASSGCGSSAGAYMRLTAASACRDSDTVTRAHDGVTVEASRAFGVEWLAAVRSSLIRMRAPVRQDELRHRYACASPSPAFHSLRCAPRGMSSGNGREPISTGVEYSVEGKRRRAPLVRRARSRCRHMAT